MKFIREHLAQVIVVVLTVVVVGIPFVLRPLIGTTEAAETMETDGKLVIYSPHNEQIRSELTSAYNNNRIARDLLPIEIDWRTSGGTSDQRKQLLSQFSSIVAEAEGDAAKAETMGVDADLFFGGGDYDHRQLMKTGNEVTDADGNTFDISLSVPAPLTEADVQSAFPEKEIGGYPLYDDNFYWTGTALSSFGIIYNRDVLGMLDLPEPKNWNDLTHPNYIGSVALADPGHSGSIAATYNTILQRNGWHEGWALLRRVFANSRYFANSATKVPMDVSAGEAAAGMCIDFYGRFQVGAVGEREGAPDRLGYVDPAGQTAITPDPITLLRGAPNRETAVDFIRWMISKDAQVLWQRRNDVEGGTRKYELRRLPIRRDVYTAAEKELWTDPEVRPFEEARPFAEAMPNFFRYVAPVSSSIAIDVHHELTAAWAAINQVGESHPNYAEMLELFDAMPEDLNLVWPDDDITANWLAYLSDTSHPRHSETSEALNAFVQNLRGIIREDSIGARLRWRTFFLDNYERIVELSYE